MNPELKDSLWEKFEALGQKALTMSHYDLAEEVEGTTKDEWRDFLNEADVAEYIKNEMRIISDSIQKRMITDIITGGDKSVGRAQIINTLDKINDEVAKKDGPIFIYSYVPLDAQQEQAENTIKLNKDIFKRKL
jgi:shikimate kinase